MATKKLTRSKLAVTDGDIHLFKQGTWQRSWEKMGAHPDVQNGVEGWRFCVWVPDVRSVHVIGEFNDWDETACPLSPVKSTGLWEGFEEGAERGQLYKYLIETDNGERLYKADPYAFYSEKAPGTASRLWTLDGYEWQDAAWLKARGKRDFMKSPLNIYEVHLGSWRRHGDEPQGEPRADGTYPGPGDPFPAQRGTYYTYDDLADELVAYARDMGYTHIEVMPLAEHPFDGSWGYQGTGFYSATSRYGTPQQLMHFIDAAHAAGIGVIMDWVPGHFCQDAQGLANFNGHMLYESEYHPNWGTYKFDFGRPEVVSFLLSNAIFWVDQFHVDGLRVDGVSSMLYLNFGVDNPADKKFNELGTEENLEASAFLRNVNGAMGTLHEDVMMIAEESTAWPLVTYPPEDGGLGFQLKWDMGWMNDTLHYMQTDFPWRPGNHNLLTFSIMYAFSENYVLPLSHDEVVNGKCSLITRMPGDQWRQFAGLRCLSLYQMTHPGAKLNFMGNEIGQYIEWRYYESIQWFLAEQFPLHAGVQEFVRTVNHLYTQEPALWQRAYTEDGFEWINANDSEQSVISYVRHGENPDDDLLVVINLTPAYYESFRVGVPREGKWKEILNSDDTRFGGSGKVNPRQLISRHEDCDGREYSILPQLPPLAGVVFKRTGTAKRKPAAKKSAAAKKPAAGKTTAKPVASKAPAKPTSATKAQAAKKAAPAPAAKPAAKKPSAPKAAVKKESTSVNSAGKRKRAK